jgi:hypothetical protein
MKLTITTTLSALAFAGSQYMADVKQLTREDATVSSACLQGDTTQRDGGPSGDLGAPKC